MAKSSIVKYYHTLKLLIDFENDKHFDLRIVTNAKLNEREFLTEKNYWKKFYILFTNYLYKEKGCFDNYVGSNIKTIRTFFKYLEEEKNFILNPYYKNFYVRKEEISIFTLTPDRLLFLIHDADFEKKLTLKMLSIKDIFVFGCTVGLRFSDIFDLKLSNLKKINNSYYLEKRSLKTKTATKIKLPEYAIYILKKYTKNRRKGQLFPKISLTNFNKNLKKIGLIAGWTEEVIKHREKMGIVKKNVSTVKFYETMTSHMMRRTAITSMLILGMNENVVRAISGHSNQSAAFYRYVNYVQSYLDNEIDGVHNILNSYSAV
jgi:integrase